MAFASGPVSFQRFFVTGSIQDEITDTFVAALNEHAFGRQPARGDDVHFGWIGPGHLFETTLAPERIAFGRFAHLALRIDRTAIPGNILRSYIRMEEETAREASGREFLSRGERRAAKEAATLRAEQEAKAGHFRRMSAYPVLIDLAGPTVYLGTPGAKVAEVLMALFSDTFGMALEPAGPEHVATRSMIAAKNARALETLAPLHLVEPPDAYGDEGEGDFAARHLAFLGRELLTWLWYHSDAQDAPLRLRAGNEITVMLDRTLRMKCDFGLTGTDVITADGAASLPEARAALQIGKQPTKAGLIIGAATGEYRLTLDGERLTVSGLVLPEQEQGERDPRALLEERFEAITDAADLLDALFELFLHRRTARDWREELTAMSAWATSQPRRPRIASA